MGRKSRDSSADMDRGSSSVLSKRTVMVPSEQKAANAEVREGLIDLGRRAASMPGLHHRTVEANQIIPVSRSQELGHPLKARPAPAPGQGAKPLSSRQKDARSKVRNNARRRTPQTEQRANKQLLTSHTHWAATNDALSQSVGDVDNLPPAMARFVRRNDSFIARQERLNDREHLVYANVEMPSSINHSNVDGFLTRHMQPGDVHAFDRYTAGTHQAHETFDAMQDPSGRRVMIRMRTRRGAYMGQSGRKDNTHHLMPRGVHMVITGVNQQTFTRPDGTTGTAWVIDMTDYEPDQEQR